MIALPSRSFEGISEAVADAMGIALANREARIVLVLPDDIAASRARAQIVATEHFERRRLKAQPIIRAHSGSRLQVFHAKGLLKGQFKPFSVKPNVYIEGGTLDAYYLQSEEREWLKSQGEKVPGRPREA